MTSFILRIISVLGFLIVIVFLFYSDKNTKCTTNLEYDLTAFDKVVHELEIQNLQHSDILKTAERLKKQLQALRSENKDLRTKIQSVLLEQQHRIKQEEEALNIQKDDLLPSNSFSTSCEAKMEEEILKKKIKNDAVELLYSISAKIKKISSAQQMDTVIKDLRMQQTGLVIDIENLIDSNEEWKKQEAESLQELVQNRIRFSQNPLSCPTARKLICLINKRCGFGCQMHHVTYCLMVAYGTGRTLILMSKGWIYDSQGWDKVFQPLSDTCLTWNSLSPRLWEESTQEAQELVLPSPEGISFAPLHVPLSIPADLAPRLKRLHGSPGVWWVSQFVKFIFRPQDWLNTEMNNYKKQIDFGKPIVGVHVRRTDKLKEEASLHKLQEYMTHVDAWYDKYDMKLMRNGSDKVQRRVFLATDEPGVIKEAKREFPDYEFINFLSFSKAVYVPRNRATRESLIGIFTDIKLLSMCNYLVCTFSSQVCRLAYELMQTYHADASDYFHSLDDIYYYGGMSGHYQKVIYDHDPQPDSEEIELKVGDFIVIAGNHWDGFSKGLNIRTQESGLYPSWKVEEIVGEVQYPTHLQADEKT